MCLQNYSVFVGHLNLDQCCVRRKSSEDKMLCYLLRLMMPQTSLDGDGPMLLV